MSNTYLPVAWNKFKKTYDLVLWVSISLYLGFFFLLNGLLFPQLIGVTVIIRAFGTLALILLHVILVIGPLCRLNPRFLPLLYNRRHLGVTMFFIASVHVVLDIIWFHSGGNVHPLLSLFAGNTHYDSLRFFPFQTLGFAAYLILMAMAFTSHDFWLNFLSPRLWKALHMLVYLAYSLIILHVVLGIIQLESSPGLFLMLMAGLIAVITLHLLSAFKEWRFDTKEEKDEDGWVYVCKVTDIDEKRAKMAVVNNERIAVFKYDNQLSAVHNVCKHQNGPLGEGMVVDGCITCPWHGYQYQPHDGCAPAPYTEKLATYRLKLVGSQIFVHTTALAEGTPVAPLKIVGHSAGGADNFFIGWSSAKPAKVLRFVRMSAVALTTVALMIALGFTISQHHIAASSFDYTHPQQVRGQLIAIPFPAIRTLMEPDLYGHRLVRTFPLVNDAKFGAGGIVNSVQKEYNTGVFMVTVKGSFIRRNGAAAIELSYGRGSVTVGSDANNLPKAFLTKVADTAITGEIVDPKCYLGAMNPGESKPHRACAILCIRGGIMPMLAFKDDHQQYQYAILLGANGESINQQIIPFVAEPVKITGKLYRFDNWYVFYINPVAVHPLFD